MEHVLGLFQIKTSIVFFFFFLHLLQSCSEKKKKKDYVTDCEENVFPKGGEGPGTIIKVKEP